MPEWKKSSFSHPAGNQCVEVRGGLYGDDSVLVRNSNRPDGHRVRFTREEWNAFIKGVKAGEFDNP